MFKVLTIDDDPAMTELLTLVLKTHGLEARVANNGEEGIRLTREFCPDVVILDLIMPGMDGWQVCHNIRSFSTVPILILSALDTTGLVAKSLDACADDYLVKPAPSGVLIAHLNTLTRRAATQKRNKLPLKIGKAPLMV